MYELKKTGKLFTSKFVGNGPSSYKKRIYRAAVSLRLRNTVLSCTGVGVAWLVQWRSGVRIPAGGKRFSYSRNFQTNPVTRLTFLQWVPGSFSGVKRPDREADHSPPSSTEVKNEWSYTSIPVFLRGVHKDTFTFYFMYQFYVTEFVELKPPTYKKCDQPRGLVVRAPDY